MSRRMCSFEQTIIQSQVHKKTAVVNKEVTRIKDGENGDQSIVQDRHEPKTNTCPSVNFGVFREVELSCLMDGNRSVEREEKRN